jgi:outer membrane protein assembly factor BamB
MNPADLLLLATKNQVVALHKDTGQILWKTKLNSGWGGEFVTLVADEDLVFAHARGSVSCLELATGKLLWTNELKGLGYGLATLAFPGGASAPDAATMRAIADRRASESTSNDSSPSQ